MEAENAFGFLELLNVPLAAIWSTTHIANLDGRRLVAVTYQQIYNVGPPFDS